MSANANPAPTDNCALKCAISFLAGSVGGGLLVHLVEGSPEPTSTLHIECPKTDEVLTEEDVKAKEGKKPLPCMVFSKIKNPEGCSDKLEGKEKEEAVKD